VIFVNYLAKNERFVTIVCSISRRLHKYCPFHKPTSVYQTLT